MREIRHHTAHNFNLLGALNFDTHPMAVLEGEAFKSKMPRPRNLEQRRGQRRQQRGVFGGRSWELEDNPWKRFEVRGSIASLVVEDLNGDGLGDIVSQTPDMLRILLSSARGQVGGR